MSLMGEANNRLNGAKAEVQEGMERAGWVEEDTTPLLAILSEFSVRMRTLLQDVALPVPGSDTEEKLRRAGLNGRGSRVAYRRAGQYLDSVAGEASHPQIAIAQTAIRQTADKMPPYFDRRMAAVADNVLKIGGLAAQLAELTENTTATLFQLRAEVLEAKDSAPEAVVAIEAYQDIAGWPKG